MKTAFDPLGDGRTNYERARAPEARGVDADGLLLDTKDGAAIAAERIAAGALPSVDISGQRGAAKSAVVSGGDVKEDIGEPTLAERVGKRPRMTRDRPSYRPPICRR